MVVLLAEGARAAAAPSGPGPRIRLVHASRAKRARAEPAAALYEQGRVTHCGDFPALEEELMTLGADTGKAGRSPDRADALVWALTALKGTSPVRLPVTSMMRARSLRVIARHGVGVDNVDLPAATELGIAVINIHPPTVLFGLFVMYGLSGYFVYAWRKAKGL